VLRINDMIRKGVYPQRLFAPPVEADAEGSEQV
jgi:hypothetical protein